MPGRRRADDRISVMELVRGVAITEYCDKATLSPMERRQTIL